MLQFCRIERKARCSSARTSHTNSETGVKLLLSAKDLSFKLGFLMKHLQAPACLLNSKFASIGTLGVFLFYSLLLAMAHSSASPGYSQTIGYQF